MIEVCLLSTTVEKPRYIWYEYLCEQSPDIIWANCKNENFHDILPKSSVKLARSWPKISRRNRAISLQNEPDRFPLFESI